MRWLTLKGKSSGGTHGGKERWGIRYRKDEECRIGKDVENEKLITFGIRPEYPETGYGYIETTESYNLPLIKSLKIKNFIEKPNLKKASEYFNKDNFLWNSGIFLFKAMFIALTISFK